MIRKAYNAAQRDALLKIGGHTIDISSRDKLFFPEAGLTKGDLIEYLTDPWSGLMRHPYSLSSRRKNLDRMLAQEKPAEEE